MSPVIRAAVLAAALYGLWCFAASQARAADRPMYQPPFNARYGSYYAFRRPYPSYQPQGLTYPPAIVRDWNYQYRTFRYPTYTGPELRQYPTYRYAPLYAF